MARVKRGHAAHGRHRRIIKQAAGYWGARHRLFKTAKEAVAHAGQYAYRDRRRRKRDFRRLWIVRISAGVREHGVSYSRFMDGMRKAGIDLNRKVLADLAVRDADAFAEIVKASLAALQA